MFKKLYGIVENFKDCGIDIIDDGKDYIFKGANWILNNPDKVALFTTTAIAFLKASQSLIVTQRMYSERNRIDHTFYDPHTGHRWNLRRKLSNYDRYEIDRRIKNGDMMYDILRDLGVI